MLKAEYETIDTETGEVRAGNGTAVARIQHNVARREMVSGLLRPVAPPEEVLAAQNEIRALVAKALTPDRDYGVIPGTKKPTLLKPGAERINAAYGVAAEYHIAEQEIDHDRPVHYVKRTSKWGKQRGEKIWTETPGQSEGLYRYVVECRLIHRASGVVVGQGIGSCSTMESKYIDRPRDLENTVLKMASKRAYIAATLNTHGLSDQFTQDLEDMPSETNGEAPAEEERQPPPAWEKEVPFGKDRGKKFGELSVKELENAKKWCEKTDAQKFAPVIADIETTLRHLIDQTFAAKDAETKAEFTQDAESRDKLNRRYHAMLAERGIGSDVDRHAFQNRLFRDGLVSGDSCKLWIVSDYEVAIEELELVPLGLSL